jgi:hypothetical protein
VLLIFVLVATRPSICAREVFGEGESASELGHEGVLLGARAPGRDLNFLDTNKKKEVSFVSCRALLY